MPGTYKDSITAKATIGKYPCNAVSLLNMYTPLLPQ